MKAKGCENLETEETLETYLGEDITHFFKGVPPIIDRLYTEMKAKYIWIPRGNMIPDDDFGHKLTHVENTYIQSKLTDEPCIIVLSSFGDDIVVKHATSIDDVLEQADQNNPYVNIVAVKKGRENEDKLVKLIEVLKSEEIKQFILNKFSPCIRSEQGCSLCSDC